MITERKLRKRVKKLRKAVRRLNAEMAETQAHCKRLCDSVGALEEKIQKTASEEILDCHRE
jgi:phage shock protein A